MACFLVPGTEAVVTTVITKIVERREKAQELSTAELQNQVTTSSSDDAQQMTIDTHKSHFSSKLKRLNYMLWGGSALLAFEHLWHGEIQPFFPFLTAASNPSDAVVMLHEMATIGVSMAALVTIVWAVIAFVIERIDSRNVAGTDIESNVDCVAK